MSSPFMLFAQTAGVLFFLVSSAINAYTLSKVKDVHENLYMGQFIIIAAFASLAWMDITAVIELNTTGESSTPEIGKWVNTFLSGVVAIIAAYSCVISKDLKNKVPDWQYEFFYWSNIFIAVFAGMRTLVPAASAGGHYVYSQYKNSKTKAKLNDVETVAVGFGMRKYGGHRRGKRGTRRRR